jgi:hypothetical protein
MATLSKQTSQDFPENSQRDDWTLTTDQMIFMLQHHNAIESAYRVNDLAFLRKLETSSHYKRVFGDMSWDEAYDRYEEMLDADT